jgi:uncharacterized protein YggE
MKARAPLPAFVFASFMAAMPPVAAAEPATTAGRKVVVNASATVYAKPDAARLVFTITTEAPVKIQEEHAKRVKTVKDILAGQLSRNVDIQAVPVSVNTITGAQAAGLPAGRNKEARTVFFVTVRDNDPDKLRELVTKLMVVAEENGGTAVAADDSFPRLPRGFPGMGAGPETIHGPRVEWLAEHTADRRQEAIKKAVADGLVSAQAAVGDAKLSVTEIEIMEFTERNLIYASRFRDTGVPDSPVIPISVTVKVTYSY